MHALATYPYFRSAQRGVFLPKSLPVMAWSKRVRLGDVLGALIWCARKAHASAGHKPAPAVRSPCFHGTSRYVPGPEYSTVRIVLTGPGIGGVGGTGGAGGGSSTFKTVQKSEASCGFKAYWYGIQP